jgi:hypothetical protein
MLLRGQSTLVRPSMAVAAGTDLEKGTGPTWNGGRQGQGGHPFLKGGAATAV